MKAYIAICDQSEHMSRHYERLCLQLARKEQYDIEVRLFATAEQLAFALEENSEKCHIIFIDINNCGANGLSTVERIKERYQDKEIVFLTSSKDVFREGFDLNVFNYVVKGEDPDQRFEHILAKAIEVVENRDTEYILLSCSEENRSIAVKSILYFEILKRTVTVHCENQKEFAFVSTLDKLEAYFESYGFVRIHRAYLVAKEKIACIHKQRKEITLRNGEVLPVGSVRYQRVKQKLGF